ncbi:hypothetical protein E1200_21865 [Actinomadura sp. GC306]|uniref:hypothetical protein n=1 Tax=Actinomadura sp. GC306 TaxID=2530367 RepID=UPI00104AE9F9|nr:hypothetical protein [Actinomadura sp. GC306]TDC63612.1 hypothetical protein E1200_21865 [Actinomadura sp. GC306]
MNTEPVLPRRPGEVGNTPAHGIPAARATPVEGTQIHPPPPLRPGAPAAPGAPIPPGAPTSPIVHPEPGRGEPPRVWGRPPVEPPPRVQVPASEAWPGTEPRGAAAWAGASEAQDAYQGPDEEVPSTTGPMGVGVRETSGVQVRLGPRERERELERRARQRAAGRRSGIVAAGVLVLAGLVTAGLVLTGGSGDGDPSPAAAGPGSAGAELPPAGPPIEVGTVDGAKYRLATVDSGISEGAVTTFHSTPPSGTSFPYIEYLLTNPTKDNVLLDFPGDVFVKRALVTPNARGRCMPQAGVPEDMCTPPTKSEVVRRLAGGGLVSGDGGDKYMPPGSTYLVRATVDVPVDSDVGRADMGLYVWKQLYMADQLAKPAPFPG